MRLMICGVIRERKNEYVSTIGIAFKFVCHQLDFNVDRPCFWLVGSAAAGGIVFCWRGGKRLESRTK